MRLLTILLMFSFPLVAAAYPLPDKIMNQIAESHCTSLAQMTLHPDDATAIAVHTEAKIVRRPEKGMHVLAVAYPYQRNTGDIFACVFQDMRSSRGNLRLLEFGLTNRDNPSSRTVKVPRLQ